MVFWGKWGFDLVDKKVKMLESVTSATTFLRLGGVVVMLRKGC